MAPELSFLAFLICSVLPNEGIAFQVIRFAAEKQQESPITGKHDEYFKKHLTGSPTSSIALTTSFKINFD